jgi:hypothetical protein
VAAYTSVKLFSGNQPDEGVIFIGDPGSLSADVWLENSAPSDLQIRRASVFSGAVRAAEPADRDRLARIQVPKRIRPHQRHHLAVSFDVDRFTPPGAYAASIVLEGEDGTTTFPAQIIVTQDYALSIEPDQIVVTVPPGGRFEGEVVVSNEGNVPIDIGPLGEYPLEDPWREPLCCCCCHDDHEDDDEHIAEAGGEPLVEGRKIGTIVIDNERKTVEPGSIAVVRFVARVSADLPTNMHLRARPRIGIERFSLDVITPSGAGGDLRPASSRRRPDTQKKKRS